MNINQPFSCLDDPSVDHNTGYTNHFLTDRNNLFPANYGGEYRRVEEKPVDKTHVYCTIKDLEPTPVSRIYFSKENVDRLQAAMISEVYQKSNGRFKISRQSDDELLIIMRSMYLQYQRNLPYKIQEQVNELNKQVLLYAVPNIMTRVQGYIGYMREQNTPNKFLSLPNYVSSAGTRIAGDFSSLII